MNNRIVKGKFLGCLLGAAIGDAVGQAIGTTIYDFEEEDRQVSSDEIQALARVLPTLSYTDDTHMTIDVAESLIACKGFDGSHMVQRFIANYDNEPWRGYAPGPPNIFELIKQGRPWNKAAAMRVSPLGLFFWDNHARLIQAVYHASRITHHHPLGVEGAILEAIAVALAVEESPTSSFDVRLFISNLLGYTTEDVYHTKIASWNPYWLATMTRPG
ncbi:ADP-ribosylglycohydrolase family protein [Chloroflexota bacterium]